MHWRSYRPSLLRTTAGSSVAYHYERQVVGMTGRVLREGRRWPGGDGKGRRWRDTVTLRFLLFTNFRTGREHAHREKIKTRQTKKRHDNYGLHSFLRGTTSSVISSVILRCELYILCIPLADPGFEVRGDVAQNLTSKNKEVGWLLRCPGGGGGLSFRGGGSG